MFWNIYLKRILCTLRDSDTVIWTWLFPLMLATLFHVAFTNLDTAGRFSNIPVAVIENDEYQRDVYFQAAINAVSGEGGDSLFDLRLLSDRDEADALLEKGEIDGYIFIEDMPTLFVTGNGLGQTITKSFLDRYLQTSSVVESLVMQNPEAAGGLGSLLNPVKYTGEISLSDNPQTSKVGYFYSLLAMVCMYGGFQGMTTITYLQANLSPLGARKTMAPCGRLRLVAYDLLGGFTMHLLSLLSLVAFINLVLGVNFGPKLWPLLLTCLAGCFLGVTFGAMVSVTSKIKEQAKIAVLITVTMVCSFLSGLMVGGINYTVAQKAPLVAWINPAARIVDALYCLYYYDTYERFFLNIFIILAMSAVMLVLTALFARRQRYDSI